VVRGRAGGMGREGRRGRLERDGEVKEGRGKIVRGAGVGGVMKGRRGRRRGGGWKRGGGVGGGGRE